MTTVAEIVRAAAQFDADQLLELRRELDRLEQQLWESELDRATEQFSRANLTEDDIDQIVLKRRRRPSLSGALRQAG
jgi:hypothetical protein